MAESMPSLSRAAGKIAFIFNPSAQSGQAARRWDEIAQLAQELSLDFERHDTGPNGQTPTTACSLATSGRYAPLVAIGGDGTISEVVSGMMRARTEHGVAREDLPSLALVPFGTANNVAKSFNLQSSGPHLRKAIETIRFGADFRFDLGQVDGRWFADAFSIGVDSSILRERNIEREKVKRSPLLRSLLRDYNLYLYAMLRVPLRHKNVAATLQVDDDKPLAVAHLTNLIVNNVRIYAGEFVFDPQSRANDGLLDVILFTGWHDYLSKFISAARISPINPRVLDKVLKRRSTNYQARRIVVSTARDVDSQVDGEEHRRGKHFEVTCVPDCLTLKTPVG